MRTAITIVAFSIVAAIAAGAKPRDDAKGANIRMLSVQVVTDPVITAEMFNPKPTIAQRPAERAVASVETR